MNMKTLFFKRALRLILILVLTSTFWGTLPAQTVRAATITVTNANDSGAGSLRQAIIDATAGDTITFDASLDGATITLASEIAIDKNLTIDGSGLSSQIRVSGDDSTRVFLISSGTVTINNLDISDGYAVYGGGIFVQGILVLNNCNIFDNHVNNEGGAIYNEGTLTLYGSTLLNNSANQSGGGILGIELKDRQKFDCGDSEIDQVGDLFDQSCMGAAPGRLNP